MNIFEELFKIRRCIPPIDTTELQQFYKRDISLLPAHLRDVIETVSMALMFEIYSPEILRTTHQLWHFLPPYVIKGINSEIYYLTRLVDDLSNTELERRIRMHQMTRSAKIMHNYRRCFIPLTNNKTVPVQTVNLLSNKGEENLKTLMRAICRGDTSEDMYRLALECGHKFFMNLDNYCNWPVSFKQANDVAQMYYHDKNGQKREITVFPTIQLTKGCINNCSHCEVCAENHLSHMPYPMFLNLHKAHDKYYRYYEKYGHLEHHLFDRFYYDSDPLSYFDPIMHVDAGDVAWRLAANFNINPNSKNSLLFCSAANKPFYFQTKGVTGDVSRRALAKAAMCSDIHVSFVDTPLENMDKNISQLHKTLILLKHLPFRRDVKVDHLCTQQGPSVDNEIFKGFPVQQITIRSIGRAKQLLSHISQEPDVKNTFLSCVFLPNGEIHRKALKNGMPISQKMCHMTFPAAPGPRSR